MADGSLDKPGGRIMPEPHSLDMYVIYEHPKDYPDKCVLRKWFAIAGQIYPQSPPIAVCDTVAQCRQSLPPNLVRFLPSEIDDPVISETWM